MPPPRPSNKSFSGSFKNKRFGGSTSKKSDFSTSSNTSSNSTGFRRRGALDPQTGNSDILSSNSDARKPRRKRRPKKKKQQVVLLTLFSFTLHWNMFNIFWTSSFLLTTLFSPASFSFTNFLFLHVFSLRHESAPMGKWCCWKLVRDIISLIPSYILFLLSEAIVIQIVVVVVSSAYEKSKKSFS